MFSSTKCFSCQEIISETDEIKCLEKFWHKNCLKCKECGLLLNLNTFKIHNKMPYCNAHIPQLNLSSISDATQSQNSSENSRIQSNNQFHQECDKMREILNFLGDDNESSKVVQSNSKIVLTSNLNCHEESDEKILKRDDKQQEIDEKKKGITDLTEQQNELEGKTYSLIERIKRIQAKQLEKHITQQLQALVKSQQFKLGIGCQHSSFVKDVNRIDHLNLSSSTYLQLYQSSPSSAEEKIKLFPPEGVKSLSTSALVNLVKRLGNSEPIIEPNGMTIVPSNVSPATNPILAKNEPWPSQNHKSESIEDEEINEKLLDPEEAEKIKIVAGTLKTNLRHLETSYDSDATESSSGGESCDENEFYNTDRYLNTPPTASTFIVPFHRKLNWKWLVERSAIASRWTWLQAQVADLEFKIRQQNEMYRQLRANKGSIAFFCKESSTVNSSNDNISKSQNGSNSNQTNEPHLSIPLDSKNSNNEEKEVYNCARILPLKQMRKRKLVRSSNALLSATRKIARYSTIQCSCTNYPRYVSPCTLCSGRYSYLQVIDTDCMPHYERYALLDPSYHPVLSLPNDVALGLHFSKLLKKETVQKPLSSKHFHKKRTPHSTDFSFKFGTDGKKIKRKSQAIISSTKLKKKYDGTTKKKFAKASSNRGIGKKSKHQDKQETSNHVGEENRNDSLSPSPLSGENSVPIHRRRRSEQYAYDINNIVIPYSIASTTRVEKLKYKEILTPKWRLVSENNLIEKTEETDEDISDDAFAIRHQKCEINEKKHFSSYLKNSHNNQGSGRGRGARARLDSNRSESGSAISTEAIQNTDSISQDSLINSSNNYINVNSNQTAKTSGMGTTTPTSTSTSTPNIDLSTINNTTINNSSDLPLLTPDPVAIHGTPAKTTERHRTSSSSKKDDLNEDENYVEVAPFEKRKFPISDSEYQEMLMECVNDDIEESKDINKGKEKEREKEEKDKEKKVKEVEKEVEVEIEKEKESELELELEKEIIKEIEKEKEKEKEREKEKNEFID